MRSQRIKIIEDLADKKQQDAATKMQAARATWLENKEQLDSLYRYRLEYQQKLNDKNGLAIGVQLIREYTLFIAKISQAIDMQNNTTLQFANTFKQLQALWIKEKRKVSALTKVRENLLEDEQQIENNAEQKIMDEFATQAFFRARQ